MEYLAIKNCVVGFDLGVLSALPHLFELKVKVRDAHISAVPPSLRILSLPKCNLSHDRFLQLLPGLQGLTCLDLSLNPTLSEQSIKAVLSALPGLLSLKFYFCGLRVESLLGSLEKASNLRVIGLDGNMLDSVSGLVKHNLHRRECLLLRHIDGLRKCKLAPGMVIN